MYHLVSYKRSDFSITLVMVSLCITFYNLYMQGWATSGFILNSGFFCGKYCIFFSNSRLISSLQVFFSFPVPIPENVCTYFRCCSLLSCFRLTNIFLRLYCYLLLLMLCFCYVSVMLICCCYLPLKCYFY